MNKDALKKHHFWILFGLIPLLVLIAVILVTSGVGAAIEAKRADIKKAQDDLNAKKNPKSNPLLALMDEQRKSLEKKKGDLWKENWERQIGIGPDGKQDPAKNLLRWPKSDKLAPFNYTADYLTDKNQLKFGDKIILAGQAQVNMNQEYNEFKRRDVYLAEFSDRALGKDRSYTGRGMADTVVPTVFDRGWERTLRYVTIPESGTTTGWGDAELRWEPLWLALEDIWVQRAMLAAVRQVNLDVGTFKLKERRDQTTGNALKDNPFDRTFRSRLWEVDLKVERREADGRYLVTGKLRNLSAKLQIFGEQTAQGGRPLVLRVGLTPDPKGPTFDFKIGGNVIAGGAEMTVLPTDEHLIQVGVTPTEINRVEQIFDAATVPVRRIDRLVLGFRDSRHAARPLVMPPFPAYEAEAAAAANVSAEGTPGNLMGGDPDGEGRGSGDRSRMMGGAGGSALEGGGTLKTVIEGNRKRYIETTKQVRRMPVAISLITDQAYIEDVLLAYANSPLRFQITQVTWQRFRGTLAASAPAAGPAGGGAKGGVGRGGFEDDPDEGPARISGGIGGSKGGGFSLGAPSALVPGGLGGAAPPPYSGGGSPAGYGGLGGGVSEGQLTAGLIELSLYGIITIYEKYDPVAAGVAAPAPAETPKADEPKAADPPKKDEPKTDEPKKDEKAADPPKDAVEPKKVDAPKPADEPKKDEPKKP